MTFMGRNSNCSRLRIDHFLNLTLLPFEFNVVKMVNSGRNLLSLSEFRNHIKEKSPAFSFLNSFIVYKLNLLRVAKVRLGMCQTLDSLTQFLFVLLSPFFQHFFNLLVMKDLLMLLNLLLRLISLIMSLRRSMMFKI